MSNSDINPDWNKLSGMSDAEKLTVAREDKLKEMLEKHQEQLPVLQKMAEVIAQAKFVNYSALVKSGFTPEQAMFLIVNGK